MIPSRLLWIKSVDARDPGHSFSALPEGQLRGGEVAVRPLAQAVREVARRGRHDGAVVGDAGLVAHAEGAARHLRARADLAVLGVVALLRELLGVHLRGRGDPEARGELPAELVLAGSPKLGTAGWVQQQKSEASRIA